MLCQTPCCQRRRKILFIKKILSLYLIGNSDDKLRFYSRNFVPFSLFGQHGWLAGNMNNPHITTGSQRDIGCTTL